MKMAGSRPRIVLLLAAAALASAVEITPVQKVVEMLNGMQAAGQQELEAEQKTFAEYSKWVESQSADLGFEIKTSTSKIESLKATIEKLENEVSQLGEKIQALDDDLARLDSEKKGATKIRETERADFLKIQQDYSESVDALERAISVIAAQNYDRPQAEMLLQQMAETTTGMRRVLAAIEDELEGTGAPVVAAYKNQNGGIQEMLEGLLRKFKGELSDVETAESNKAHFSDLANLHLGDSIAHSTADREDKAATKAARTAESAKAQGVLADTVKELAEEKQFLSDIQVTFKSKAVTFKANQQVRKDELQAIAKAVEIISSPDVASSYAEHINLAQLATRGTALVQTRSANTRSAVCQKAAALLQGRARALSSTVLASIAEQVATNPFTKVIQLIEGLLAKLKDEASAESEHKAWCDEQLAANKLKRERQTTTVEKLTAQIEEAASSIASAAAQIETLAKEQADLTTAVQEATEQRQKEKAANTKAIAGAQAGSSAVKQALVVLREFYASHASLLQRGKQAPELAEYNGQQARSTGVIGILEVIASDFLRLETDTKTAEDRAARDYDSFTADAEADKLAKHNAEVKLRLSKDQTEFDKSQLEKDLAGNQDELDKANTYFKYLKPSCLEVKVSYEERVARRQEEIEALKQAYDVLDQKSSD